LLEQQQKRFPHFLQSPPLCLLPPLNESTTAFQSTHFHLHRLVFLQYCVKRTDFVALQCNRCFIMEFRGRSRSSRVLGFLRRQAHRGCRAIQMGRDEGD
jgi:hypothetical protein